MLAKILQKLYRVGIQSGERWTGLLIAYQLVWNLHVQLFLLARVHLWFGLLQAGQSSVAVNQIELDLLRTLPTNKYYDKPDAQGVWHACVQPFPTEVYRLYVLIHNLTWLVIAKCVSWMRNLFSWCAYVIVINTPSCLALIKPIQTDAVT